MSDDQASKMSAYELALVPHQEVETFDKIYG
jgi:hypothetical protein